MSRNRRRWIPAVLAPVLVAGSVFGFSVQANAAIDLPDRSASQILATLPQLEVIHPYLLTFNWFGFADLLRAPMDFHSMGVNALLQLGYLIIFGSAAYSRFATKDILS